MPTWFITGCSTGLGRELALAVLRRGWNAVVTARDPRRVADVAAQFPDTALALPLEVGDHAQVESAVAAATERFGAIDVLVNNAGHGFRAAVEEAEDDEVAELFATNFFGPVDLVKAVLPQMRERRSGTIVNVSSIGAPRSNPASGYYSATKSALESVSDALAREVGPLGIHVLVLEPGALRTEFSGGSLLQSRRVIEDYAGTAGLRRKENDRTHGTQPGDPARAAETVVDVVAAGNPPFRLLLGSDALAVVRDELTGRLTEIDAWEDTSAATDFPTA